MFVVLGVKFVKVRVGELDFDLLFMLFFDLFECVDKYENLFMLEEIEGIFCLVEEKLVDFNIEVMVVGVFLGFVIIWFEFDLVFGVKVSKILGLLKDLVCVMLVILVCVVEVILGKLVIGLELLNKKCEMVWLSEVISCDIF